MSHTKAEGYSWWYGPLTAVASLDLYPSQMQNEVRPERLQRWPLYQTSSVESEQMFNCTNTCMSFPEEMSWVNPGLRIPSPFFFPVEPEKAKSGRNPYAPSRHHFILLCWAGADIRDPQTESFDGERRENRSITSLDFNPRGTNFLELDKISWIFSGMTRMSQLLWMVKRCLKISGDNWSRSRKGPAGEFLFC